ncbi:beta-glucan synthesis-associated [Ascodesmis nigricans]|uniref:Beta-glucan synthesis-associated n=1 Tax=Ascodesmis nigricans TaxID=341454 RepID=A0A4S2MK27_9PEZI|nr:beta-glucan synthesis-associated [Ascodesmis nigricans]
MIVTGDKASVTSDIPFASPGSFSGDEGAFAPFGFGVNGDRDGGWLRFPIGASDTSIYPSWNEKENDDDLHNPAKDGPKFVLKNIKTWNPWICLQLLFLILIVLGVLCAGVLYPILLSIRVFDRERPPERLSEFDFGMLEGIRTSMIDPDTPDYAMTRDSVLGRGKLKLVFSDEFEQDGRTFYPGEDQFWTAPRIHYAATNDLEMYDPDFITTKDGVLEIRFQTYRDYDLDFRSGMLQSWNKLCFKGGVMEVSASLAGPAGVAGLWPGIWSLGNLARPGFRASSDGVWPYSYDQCDVGITPNQSSTDGISFLPGQRLAKCVCKNEDHPSPGTGRGAPEIDALEGTINYDMKIGEVTQSSQMAPFDIWYQTNYDYVAIKNHSVTRMNSWQGGPFQQAVSGVTMLNNDWYDGKQYQKYAFEYIPGKADGAIAWFVGDEETLRMTGNAIGPNGNIGQRDISQEPMSIILNLGMSENWAWIDMERLAPRLAQGTVMRIDYVRIYQEEGKELLTCDPPGYPTTEYIAKHPKAYDNANLTQWDETGYPWPKNKFMDQCH